MSKLCKYWLQVFFLLLTFTSSSLAQTYWWNDAVFYEVFVRSFKDSDGDGNGDLRGLIEKLDYLNDGDPATHHDLGVTAIWLMPVQQSPSYHGYDIIDYRTIEQDYGTNADFTEFITEAHNRGMKVIIDYVMNHTSSQHPWFVDALDPLSDKRDWYIWENTHPGNTGPWGQTVWHSRNGYYNYGIFWSEMPDLNYNTPEVKTEMYDIARFWLEDMNVDGFRLDAIKYIYEDGNTLEDTPETIQFWKDFRTHYKSLNADALAVGEAWTSTDKVQPYVGNDGLDFCFEFDLATAILNAANAGNTAALKDQLDEVIAAYPFLQYGTFLSNHDMNRVMNQLGSNTAKAKVVADLLLTLPGVPYIYYGEEIGMTGAKPDEDIRKPMQWNSGAHAGFTSGTPWRTVNADYTTKNVQLQQNDYTSLWHHYRKLIAIRNNQAALRKGSYKNSTTSAAGVFAFLRQYNDENVIVVSNTGASLASNVQISLEAGSIAEGSYVMTELQGGGQLPVNIDPTGGLSNFSIGDIPARSTLIYKLLDASEVNTVITFEIDMNELIDNGDFNPATESVDIIADFNDFGNTTTTALEDLDGDGIYTVVVNGDAGSKINYKYRLNGVNDGREEFSNSAFLREYLVLEGANTVKDIYQQQDVTGIKPSLKNFISLYPVPSQGELFMNVSSNFQGAFHYRVTDLAGQEIISSSFIAGGGFESYRLSTENLPAGVFLLTVSCQGMSDVFRVVIQK